MMKILITIAFLCVSLMSTEAQINSIGFYINGIHNFNYLDNSSDIESTIKLPFYPLYTYGFEYSNKLGLYASLGLDLDGIKVSRKFTPIDNGKPLNLERSPNSNGQSPSLKIGYLKNYKSLRISAGINFRYFSTNSFVPKSGKSTFDNESYQPFADYEFTLNPKIHSSIYINIDWKLFNIDKNELRLNFISNLGLHPIYQVTSILENFVTNETKTILHNNYGTYLGIGLKFTRSSEGNFKEIFQFNFRY